MKKYTVVVSKTAEKELHRLPAVIVKQVITVLKSFEENPRPHGCKKLKGYKNLWRIRITDYRVIYTINDTVVLVEVLEIGHRRDIYR